jgi:hypothetical protein
MASADPDLKSTLVFFIYVLICYHIYYNYVMSDTPLLCDARDEGEPRGKPTRAKRGGRIPLELRAGTVLTTEHAEGNENGCTGKVSPGKPDPGGFTIQVNPGHYPRVARRDRRLAERNGTKSEFLWDRSSGQRVHESGGELRPPIRWAEITERCAKELKRPQHSRTAQRGFRYGEPRSRRPASRNVQD